MSKFKVGDRVEFENDEFFIGEISDYHYLWSDNTKFNGKVGKLDPRSRGFKYSYAVYEASIKLIEESKNNMNIKSIYKNITRKEPERSFVKAGITDSNDELTQEGKDLFLSFLLEQHKDEFNKTVVQPILEEQKKEDK